VKSRRWSRTLEASSLPRVIAIRGITSSPGRRVMSSWLVKEAVASLTSKPFPLLFILKFRNVKLTLLRLQR